MLPSSMYLEKRHFEGPIPHPLHLPWPGRTSTDSRWSTNNPHVWASRPRVAHLIYVRLQLEVAVRFNGTHIKTHEGIRIATARSAHRGVR